MNKTAAPTRHSRPPFAVSAQLPPDLARVRDYWRGLLRGSAAIPFTDDFRPNVLGDLGARLFLVGVQARPERFRFESVGARIGLDFEGRFLDETGLGKTGLGPPFEFLRAQCAATVEGAAPTAFRHDADPSYERLLLPLWGDGRIDMLLGAVAFG